MRLHCTARHLSSFLHQLLPLWMRFLIIPPMLSPGMHMSHGV
jgi:hypothetical protein